MLLLGFFLSILIYESSLKPAQASVNCNCQDAACVVNIAVIANADQQSEINSEVDLINERAEADGIWKINRNFYDISTFAEDKTKWKLTKLVSEFTDVNVLIGPIKSDDIQSLHPIAVYKDWVHIAPYTSEQSLSKQLKYPNLIRMLPSDNFQTEAIVSLLGYYRHTEISIMGMDESYGRAVIDLLSLKIRWKILVAKFFKDHLERQQIREILNEIHQYDSHAIILSANITCGHTVLEEAYKINMTVVNGWEWIVMGGITAQNVKPAVIEGKVQYFGGVIGTRQFHYNDLQNPQSSNVITEKYKDSLLALEKGLKEVCKTRKNGITTSQLRTSILTTPSDNPNLGFSSSGSVSPARYDIVQSVHTNWSIIGEWDSDNQLKMQVVDVADDVKFHVRVTTIVEYPFVYYNKSKLAGFCIDLLNELAAAAGFEYSIELVADGQYGGFNEATGNWTGMIGETKRGVADLAAGPITITSDRSGVVNFLPSFINLGLKFIVNRTLGLDGKYHTTQYNAYAFLYPYAWSMYKAIGYAVVLMSVFLCFLSKVSPYGMRGQFFLSDKADIAKTIPRHSSANLKETRSSKRLREERKDAENGMSLNNAFYFVWAALFWQSPERVPRSISARVVTIGWYMAAVAFVASYTANMVAVVAQNFIPITLGSISDLLLQNQIAFGTVENSAVETQLRSSGVELAAKLYNAISDTSNPKDFFVANVSEGMDLVRTQKFALLWDSIALDSIVVQSGCKLKTVSVGFGEIVFAFAMTQHSPHYHQLARHALNLKDMGVLKRLKDKYFGELDQCEHLNHMLGHGGDSSVKRLRFTDLAGVFYFVAMAMGIGVVILIAEWIVVVFADVKKSDPTAPQTLKESFIRRKNRLVQDVINNWFPFHEVMERWITLTLPAQDSAENIVLKRTKGDLSGEKSGLNILLRSNVSESALSKPP